MAPSGVSIHVARGALGWRNGAGPPSIDRDAVRAFASPSSADDAAELVATTGVSVVAYALEETLARPVLSANQVLFWHALRVAGLDEPSGSYGSELSKGMARGLTGTFRAFPVKQREVE